MTDKQIIIEDCPYFIGGNCQEYLDGVCENHKCDLKIIRELEEKLSNKRKECDELRETVKSQKEEIKNLNYTLYEERNLTTDLAKANLKISTLERSLSSVRNRFKNENQQNKEALKAKEKECEELKEKVIKWLGKEGLRQSEKEFYEQQLDQLKTELEQMTALKDTYFACYHAKHEDLAKKYDQLKAEGDLAKQLINWILKFFELTDYDWQDDQNEISALIEDYIDDKNSTIDFVNDINKGLFKKLTEIKEIALKACECCGECQTEFSTKDYCDFNEILQKISECEVVDET